MPNGTPEEERRARLATVGEIGQVSKDLELRGIYPIGGEDLLKELREATLGETTEVVRRFLAIKEGLFFGPDYYDLNKPEQLLWLYNLFTTKESAGERPADLYYPEVEVNNKIYKRVREIKATARKDKSRELTEGEEREISSLTDLESHRRARELIDTAFIQRMAACEEAEAVANLLGRDPNYRPSVKPDKGHWMAFFSGEFGEGIDRVLRRIAVAATPPEELEKLRTKRGERFEGELKPIEGIKPSIYATGFQTTEAFKDWLSDLLKTAGGRMDIVWAAWRLALTWEIPAQLGISTEGGKIKIADPPIGNDLFAWTVDIDKKRTMEWGLDNSGQRVRRAKYLTHTGYPLSLGHINKVCQDYLHEAVVDEPVRGKDEKKKKPLWEIWWEEGRSLADQKFPWALTDLQPGGLDTEELPPASFGGWFLKRRRAFTVVEDIRSRPGIKDLSDPDFFGKRVRNWDKVLGTYEDKEKELKRPLTPEENPRAWWMGGILLFSHWLGPKEIPLVKNSPDELGYKTRYPAELWSTAFMGKVESRPISVWEVLNHTYQCGFLRKVDIDWLVKNLAIPAPLGGAKAY